MRNVRRSPLQVVLHAFVVASLLGGPMASAQPAAPAAPAKPAAPAASAKPAQPAAPRPNSTRVKPPSPLAGTAKKPGAVAPAKPAQPAGAKPAPAPVGPAAGGAAGTAGGPAAGQGLVELPGEKEFNQCKKLPAGKRIVKVNLKPDSEISDLIAWISASSCTPFIIASTTPLSGKKVTIMSPELITPEEGYRLFIGALEAHNLTVEPMGRFLRIVDTSRARFTGIPFYKSGERPGVTDKRFITRLFRFDHLDAQEVLNNLYNTTLRGEQGFGVAFQGSLIISDTATMLERFERIVHELDAPSEVKEKIWIVRVKNMSASEMTTRLAEIFQVQQIGTGGRRPGSPGAPAPVAAPAAPTPPKTPGAKPNADLASQLVIRKLIPDERSNSLFVMANDTAYEWLLTILKRLDQPIEGGGDGRVHLYYCEHANCDELAATLSAITGVAVVGGGARRSTRAGAPGAPAPAPVAAPGAPGQQGANALLFEGEVRMAFDGPTNALLVFSSLKDFQALRKVIEKLDSPRKQVYIEAMVLEVLLDKTRDTGVAYHGGIPTTIGGKETLILGGFDANKTLSPAGLVTDLGGLSGALFGPLLNQATSRIFGTNLDIPSFGAFIKLLQSNNDVNVLQLPNLLIMNNQEGEFKVGQNLPFPGALMGGFGGGIPGLGGQGGALGGFGFPSVSVQRQDVALQIKLIPSVNEHNMIRLDVDVEISDVASQNYNGMGPATSKRTVKTQVVCKDQQTVVTGGIIADRQSESTKKIPILGDIPIIGFFFRNKHVEMQKTNILIALTPYVISDMADLQRVAEKKMRERRDFLERYSAFEDNAKFEANIDYRRKRGMFEEMNTFAREIDEEEEQLRNIRKRDLENETQPLEPASRRGAPGSDKTEKPSGAEGEGAGRGKGETKASVGGAEHGAGEAKSAFGASLPLPTDPADETVPDGADQVALTRRR